MAARESVVVRRKKKGTPNTFTARVVCPNPEPGLLSNWSKNKRFFEPRSNWLNDCMFDLRCNFKIMAAAAGDEQRIFRCSYFVS